MPQAIGTGLTSRLHVVLRTTVAVCALALALASVADAAGPAPRPWLARHSVFASPVAGLPAGQLGDLPTALRRRLVSPLRSVPTSTIASPDASGAGTIEGKVTSSASGEPIVGVSVCAFPREEVPFESEEPPYECTSSGSDGEYAMKLPAGEYDVEFFVPFDSELNYQPQYYNGVTKLALATPVQVTSGGDEKGIGAVLLPGGAISGVVTSATTSAPLSGVIVCANDKAVEVGNCAVSGAAGAFKIVGLASGSYEVDFITDPEAETTYVYQAYPGPVGVTAPDTTPGIDVALRLTPPIARSRPVVAGSPVAGQTLTVTHASWSNQPTSFRDKWLRCAMSASTICLILGTGESYTLQSSDVGSVIRVKEWAFGTAGEGEPVASAPTSIVLAAPTPSAPAAPPTPPAPTPATGSLASQSALASVAQLRSLLDRLLVPAGKGAKISRLVKHRGYALSFVALSAGKVTISWYLVPPGAHASAAKPVLAASGSVSMANGGRAKLTIKLTAKGRSLLAHASRVKLTAKGALTGTGHAALYATRTFTLKS